MENYHQFDPKMFRIEYDDKANYFVIAYSEVHAIVELVNFFNKDLKNDIDTFILAGEFDVSQVHLVSKKEMKEKTIDYNYATDSLKRENLYDVFKKLTKFKQNAPDFYGAVGDDFIDYGI